MDSTVTERADVIAAGKAVLGLELGSTRIKAVLAGPSHEVLASGSFDWENELSGGVWTYPLDAVHEGLRSAYGALKAEVRSTYGVTLSSLRAMGVSAMMHGYLAFGKDGNLLVPFRTWRNTMTAEASRILSEEFGVPVPERWSAAHLYQAVLAKEEHLGQLSFLTTLAGYVHWRLTGRKVIGTGDASGMFPVDSVTGTYDAKCLAAFDALVPPGLLPGSARSFLPDVLLAGQDAGFLTEEGARLLDGDGDLRPGIPLCPPEGDAGTGMVATNSVLPRTGNVSAGTSVFAMVVLEKPLSKAYTNKIDIVATPDGHPAAMAHANNCTGEYDKWISLFGESARLLGARFTKDELYGKLLGAALGGEADCGGIIAYNYLSGESMTGFGSGRPLVVRAQGSALTLCNFMRAQLFSSLCALRTGMDILLCDEGVRVERLSGHGGFFKAGDVGQRMMAAALGVPVSVLSTAGEGGPWGMALLASYMAFRSEGGTEPLAGWLSSRVFSAARCSTAMPDAKDAEGFNRFYARHMAAAAVERAAVEFVE